MQLLRIILAVMLMVAALLMAEEPANAAGAEAATQAAGVTEHAEHTEKHEGLPPAAPRF